VKKKKINNQKHTGSPNNKKISSYPGPAENTLSSQCHAVTEVLHLQFSNWRLLFVCTNIWRMIVSPATMLIYM